MEEMMKQHKLYLLAVSGYSGSGKDSFADALVERGYMRFAFGDRVKEALYALNPAIGFNRQTGAVTYLKPFIDGTRGSFTEKWDLAKSVPEVRRLLQRIGTEVGRDFFGQTVWVDLTFRKILATIKGEEGRQCVVTDVRFPSEAEAIHRAEGIVVRIHRPNVGPLRDAKNRVHSSEIALDDWKDFDYHIYNEGSLKDLTFKANALAEITEREKESNGPS